MEETVEGGSFSSGSSSKDKVNIRFRPEVGVVLALEEEDDKEDDEEDDEEEAEGLDRDLR
jgi:hypothetical protein